MHDNYIAILKNFLQRTPCRYEACQAEYIRRGIDREVVSNIPAVPINTMYPSLPDRVDWLSSLWDTCPQRMTESAQHTFLRANAYRIKLATSGQKHEDNHKPLREQALFYMCGSKTSKAWL